MPAGRLGRCRPSVRSCWATWPALVVARLLRQARPPNFSAGHPCWGAAARPWAVMAPGFWLSRFGAVACSSDRQRTSGGGQPRFTRSGNGDLGDGAGAAGAVQQFSLCRRANGWRFRAITRSPGLLFAVAWFARSWLQMLGCPWGAGAGGWVPIRWLRRAARRWKLATLELRVEPCCRPAPRPRWLGAARLICCWGHAGARGAGAMVLRLLTWARGWPCMCRAADLDL